MGISQTLKSLLADPVLRGILEMLGHGPEVREIAQAFELDSCDVSYHLSAKESRPAHRRKAEELLFITA